MEVDVQIQMNSQQKSRIATVYTPSNYGGFYCLTQHVALQKYREVEKFMLVQKNVVLENGVDDGYFGFVVSVRKKRLLAAGTF